MKNKLKSLEESLKNKKTQNVEVLISAMNLSDTSIIDRTNIQTNVVLINQSDFDEYKTLKFKASDVKFFSTTERGLSNSRNKAIELASGDICLLCDDDEFLYKDYEDVILKAYSEMPDADLIAFKFLCPQKTYSNSIKKIGYLNVSTISSVELTFKRETVIDSKINFNIYFGSGSVYSSGEENMFLYDCLRKGLKIYYFPIEIGKLVEGKESTWFNGFNENYFFNKGAWLSACFPLLKYILIFYVTFRFRKLSEINSVLTFKYLWHGMRAYKNKLSYMEFKQKSNA
jgi:glycosyltransferase involved in cell wall biosynthesis